MTDTYVIKHDPIKFKSFMLNVDDFIDMFPEEISALDAVKFSIKNMRLANFWNPPDAAFTSVDEAHVSIPDIAPWIGGSLILSPKAHAALEAAISDMGEFLPININNHTYWFFNCLVMGKIDEINSARNIIQGLDMGAKVISFNSVDIQDKPIFKTRYNDCSDLFCTEQFKDVVETSGLTGVEFVSNLSRIY